MKNHLIFLTVTALGLLAGCATTGPDESAKSRIASIATNWANAFNKRDFNPMVPLYGLEVDFNGRPMKRAHAVFRMQDFLAQDHAFDAFFSPSTWKLDSMRGDIYAGHLNGHAKYSTVPDSIPLEIALQIRMKEESFPFIIKQSDNIGSAHKTLKERKRQLTLAGDPFDENGNPSYYFWQEILDSAALHKPGHITQVGVYQDLFYIYVATAAENGKYGIADISGKLILPMEYNDLGTIGVFAPNTVEVKRGDLKGLARLDGTLALPAEYDALLPGFGKDGVTVWAQKEGSWQAYGPDLSPLQPEGGNSAQGPDWASWLTALPFESDWDCRTEFYKPAFLANVYQYEPESEANLDSYYVLRLPFAMTERNLFGDLYGGSAEGGDYGTRYNIDSVFTAAEDKIGILTTIERWGIGGRDTYHEEELRWVVFEQDLSDTAQSVPLYNRNIAEDAHCSIGGYRMWGDSLLQVISSNDYLLDYYAMPAYRYYRLVDGRLTQLHPQRDFPFMSVLRIDADFLRGCFFGNATDEERAAFAKTQKDTLEQYQSVDRATRHFTADDLDYLVNEVYAAYGLRFKGEKWQKYFGDKKWYKPIADDVEGQLSAIERSNIAFVRNVQSKVRQSEASYTHAEFSIGEHY